MGVTPDYAMAPDGTMIAIRVQVDCGNGLDSIGLFHCVLGISSGPTCWAAQHIRHRFGCAQASGTTGRGDGWRRQQCRCSVVNGHGAQLFSLSGQGSLVLVSRYVLALADYPAARGRGHTGMAASVNTGC